MGKSLHRPALACLLALDLLSCAPRPSAPLGLRCTTAYGGERRVLDVTPTRAPYRVEATALGQRFLFRAVYVNDPAEVPRVALSVFTQDDPPQLLQEVTYRPPYPSARPSAPYGFTGLTRVYSETARELTYWCAFVPSRPRSK